MKTYVVKDDGNQMIDLYGLDKGYGNQVKNLDKVAFHSEEDRRLFIQFLRSMEARGIGYVQLTKYILAMKTFLKSYNKPLESLTKTDLENFLLYMRPLKPATRQTRWYAIKKFFDYINLGNVFFPVRFETRNKLPDDILSEGEIEKLVSSTCSLRNKAFISVLCEGGYRVGEILTAKVKDVLVIDYGIKIMVKGKTGMRNPLLIESAPIIKEYIKGKGKEERLFDISYPTADRILKIATRRVGIDKRVHLHSLRHSAATRDANHLTESQMCMKYGWRIGSRMCRVYVQLSGRGLDDAILKMHGIDAQISEEFEHLKKSGIG